MNADERIHQIVMLPSLCPGCWAMAGQTTWPEGTTSQYCAACVLRLRRSLQCQQWNAQTDHQRHAGQVRAQSFTSASQQIAGFASWAAFSARWRAEQGLPPLEASSVVRYVTPEMIRGPLGQPIGPALQQQVYAAWVAGHLYGVLEWLTPEPPPDAPIPDGGLFDGVW